MSKYKMPEKQSGVKITLPKARLSFPDLFEPKQYQGKGEKYYKATFLWPKDTNLKAVKAAFAKAIAECFPDASKRPKIKLPWRDGDDANDYDGYEGHYYVSAKSGAKFKPVVLNRDKTPLTDDSLIYGGAYVDAVVVAKVTESGGNFFLSLYLQGVRLVEAGERFGGAVSTDDFEDLEDESDFVEESNEDDDMGF